MSRVKTFDRNFLANNPTGDQTTGLTLSVLVPARIDVPDNPDGTRPTVTFQVDGSTYAAALAALGHLHDEGGDELVQVLLGEVVTAEELGQFDSFEAAAPLLTERVHEITTPFRTFAWSVSLEFDEQPTTVDFELTAPSLAVGMQAVIAMTTPAKLVNIAVGLCPETDNEGLHDGDCEYDEHDGDTVLVRA